MEYKPTPLMAEDSHYDPKAARRVELFIESLKHTKGQFHNKRFELLPWQRQIIRDVFGVLKPNGYRQFNTAYIEVPKKQGKQLSLDTLIPTPDGFTTMGEIKVGDEVFDSLGSICHVVAKSDVDYEEQAYRITFKDGEVIEAGERHLWTGEYTHGKVKPRTMTTGELYRMPKEPRSDCFRFRISVAGAIDLPERDDLPIDPYLMGYWLGNGNAVKSEITIFTPDVDEVLSNITPYHSISSSRENVGNSIVCRIPDLKVVLLKSFHDKAIPEEYLRSSVSQRFRLLQGLMDSDGCISVLKGQAIYCSTEKSLAESVSELLWSLGIKNAISTAES